MKNIINIFLVVLVIFFFLSCKNTVSPDEPAAFKKGEYSGTFSVTFKNYKNFYSPLTQTGTITIFFYDSTYTYQAIVNYSSGPDAVDTLSDFGAYSIDRKKILMNDESWMRMDARWHNSLYLFDKFNIQRIVYPLQISQDNSFAKWDLILALK